jgi:hypothetical protein
VQAVERPDQLPARPVPAPAPPQQSANLAPVPALRNQCLRLPVTTPAIVLNCMGLTHAATATVTAAVTTMMFDSVRDDCCVLSSLTLQPLPVVS